MKHFGLAALAICGTVVVALAWIFRAALPFVLIGIGAALGFWLLMQGVLWQIAR